MGFLTRPDALSTLGARVVAVPGPARWGPRLQGEAVSGLQSRTRALCAPRASRAFGWSIWLCTRSMVHTKGTGTQFGHFRAANRIFRSKIRLPGGTCRSGTARRALRNPCVHYSSLWLPFTPISAPSCARTDVAQGRFHVRWSHPLCVVAVHQRSSDSVFTATRSAWSDHTLTAQTRWAHSAHA